METETPCSPEEKMGYYMEMEDCKILIPSNHFADMLSAIKAIMSDNPSMGGGTYGGGGLIERHYSWVSTERVLDSKDVTEALHAWRWHPNLDDDGNIFMLYFNGEKLGQDEVLFKAIAPYVTEGSYVAMRGEDGALWRWYFDGNNCVKQEGMVVYR
jgi:hypothetical protein